ncbi:MAG: T9SS type A sorting domain-containing protein, partial [Candidatus Kapaibacteriota bacterium]
SYKIDSLIFFVTLGNDTATTVTFEQFVWNCDKVDVQTTNGMVIVENICREAGHRLFDLGNIFYISEVPSPVTGELSIKFYAIEKGLTELKILNYFGGVVQIPFSNVLEPGLYELKLSTKELSNGLYFLILETPTSRVARSLLILN